MVNQKYYGEWLLVIVTIIAAAGWVFSKEAITAIPPFLFIGLRFFMAGAILLLVCFITHQYIDFSQFLKVIFAGSLLAININLWIFAISFGGAIGEGSFIMSLSILMIPLISWLIFKQRPLAIFWVSLPIAIIGLACLSFSNGWSFSISQVWFLLASLSFALFFNVNSRFVQNIAVLPLTSIQLLFAGGISLIFSLLFETWTLENIDGSIINWFLASVFIATIFRYGLQIWGQKHVPVGNAAIIMVLEPIFTTVTGVWLYNEPMPLTKWFGCGLIFIALFIYRGYVFIRMRHLKK